MNKNLAWHQACKEIIDRCVAPDMYSNAKSMLDKALHEAGKSEYRAEPLAQPVQPVHDLTDSEITSIAYDCNALPEVVTDATLAVFARVIEVRSRALVQPVRPAPIAQADPLSDGQIKKIAGFIHLTEESRDFERLFARAVIEATNKGGAA